MKLIKNFLTYGYCLSWTTDFPWNCSVVTYGCLAFPSCGILYCSYRMVSFVSVLNKCALLLRKHQTNSVNNTLASNDDLIISVSHTNDYVSIKNWVNEMKECMNWLKIWSETWNICRILKRKIGNEKWKMENWAKKKRFVFEWMYVE